MIIRWSESAQSVPESFRESDDFDTRQRKFVIMGKKQHQKDKL